MRTTVTLDPDVETLLRHAVRDSGVPFKQVLNDAVREGLRVRGAGGGASRAFRQRTFNLGKPRVDLTRANALADQLGDDALLSRMRARP
jgi:hypothetical protein